MSNWDFPEQVILHGVIGDGTGLNFQLEQPLNAYVKIEKKLVEETQELIATNCIFILEGEPDVEIGDYIEYDSHRYEVTFFTEHRDFDGQILGIRCTTK